MVSENGTALDAYELARNLLVKRGVARETIDEVFSPAIPPSIPVLPASIVARSAITLCAGTSTQPCNSRASAT
jgi:hypothetical protein